MSQINQDPVFKLTTSILRFITFVSELVDYNVVISMIATDQASTSQSAVYIASTLDMPYGAKN